MPVGEAEGVEVVARGLDLAAVDDLVAETEEEVLDVPPYLCRRMERTAAPRAHRPEQLRRQRDVDRLRREPRVELYPLKLLLAGRERLLDRLARRVQGHPGLAVAHLAQRELQIRLATEVLDAELLELAGGRRGVDRRERLALKSLSIHGGDCIRASPHHPRVGLRLHRARLRSVAHGRDGGR